MTFGEHLAAARKSRGMGFRELGRLSGISYGHVRRIERGQTENLNVANLCKLAVALGDDPVEWFRKALDDVSNAAHKDEAGASD